MPSGKVTVVGSPRGGGKPQASVSGGHFSPGFSVFVLKAVSGRTTHPGAGLETLQMPSPSNPNSSISADSGIEEIAFEELFWIPMSASSAPSYGPCEGSDSTVVSVSVAVNRNWQLVSSSTAGHCVNAAFADGARYTRNRARELTP